ncbi:hypothetical protein KIPB_004689 [Kipferlia bialata]|uniref:P-loop containing nucleoside triphosphate hydrolase n=1 Tax=Kipferlia bialata TaxID=797122 RepID=A0A9K3CU67_9EUKA|nr:hypothetical protein KIPB_004689 [Kipferlia bialata]|eukprot:g4689.t1
MDWVSLETLPVIRSGAVSVNYGRLVARISDPASECSGALALIPQFAKRAVANRSFAFDNVLMRPSIVSCTEGSVGSVVLRHLCREGMYGTRWMEDTLIGRSGTHAAETAVDILRKCVSMAVPVTLNTSFFQMAINMFPSRSDVIRGILSDIKEQSERRTVAASQARQPPTRERERETTLARQPPPRERERETTLAKEAEEARRSESASFCGTPRATLHPLGLGETGDKERARERSERKSRAVVRTGYRSQQAYLDTYTHLERLNCTHSILEAIRIWRHPERYSEESQSRVRGVMRVVDRTKVVGVAVGQRDLELTVSLPKETWPLNPKHIDHGRLMLLSGDGFHTFAALQSVGDYRKIKLERQRSGPTSFVPGYEDRDDVLHRDTLVAACLLPSMHDVPNGQALDTILQSRCQCMIYGDMLVPAILPVISNLKAKDETQLPFASHLTGADLVIPRPAFISTLGGNVDASLLYPLKEKGEKVDGVAAEDSSDHDGEGQRRPPAIVLSADHIWPGEAGGPAVWDDRACIADSTQMKAIRHTMNHRLSIIRGGPGTGKSYVTVQILMLLARMRFPTEAKTRPLTVLVQTLTNQALDTLAESLLRFGVPASSLLRIGGKTKTTNESLKARQLRECKKSLVGRSQTGSVQKEREYCIKALRDSSSRLLACGRLLNTLAAAKKGKVDFASFSKADRQGFLSECVRVFKLVYSSSFVSTFDIRVYLRMPTWRQRKRDAAQGVVSPLVVGEIPGKVLLETAYRTASISNALPAFQGLLSTVDKERFLLWAFVTGDTTAYKSLIRQTIRRMGQHSAKRGTVNPDSPARPSPLHLVGGTSGWSSPRVNWPSIPVRSSAGSSTPVFGAPMVVTETVDSEAEGEGPDWRDVGEGSEPDSQDRVDTVLYTQSQSAKESPSNGVSETLSVEEKESQEDDRLQEEFHNAQVARFLSSVGTPFTVPPDRVISSLHDAVLAHVYEPMRRIKGISTPSSLSDGLASIQAQTREFNEVSDASVARGIARHGIQFILMTSTAAARDIKMLERVKPQVCVVEEAGELREGQLLACLPTSLQQLILIGDEQQLQPKVEHALKRSPVNYGWSMFERLTRLGVSRVQLKTQRRMRPEICGLINYAFAQGLSTDMPARAVRGRLLTIAKPVSFISHSVDEDPTPGTSHVNKHESRLLVNLIPVLCNNGYSPCDITLVALYKAQMTQMTEDIEVLCCRLRGIELQYPSLHVLRCPLERLSEVQVATLDDFQGQENKVVLVSLTRSDTFGFVAERNRALVTLSRAKETLIIAGHSLFLDNPNPVWQRVVAYFKGDMATGSWDTDDAPIDRSLIGLGPSLRVGCERHNNYIDYSEPSQLEGDTGFATGGCNHMCHIAGEPPLACGHTCPLKCHGNDHSLDSGFRCTERCSSVCKRGHQCQGQCHMCMPGGVAPKQCQPCTVSVHGKYNKWVGVSMAGVQLGVERSAPGALSVVYSVASTLSALSYVTKCVTGSRVRRGVTES